GADRRGPRVSRPVRAVGRRRGACDRRGGDLGAGDLAISRTIGGPRAGAGNARKPLCRADCAGRGACGDLALTLQLRYGLARVGVHLWAGGQSKPHRSFLFEERIDVPTDANNTLLVSTIFGLTYLALAVGKVPGLKMDRAGIALVGAAAMLACGVLNLHDAAKAVDYETIVLLFGMMIVVAYLKLSGFFALATERIASHFSGPRTLLAVVIGLSGVLSVAKAKKPDS